MDKKKFTQILGVVMLVIMLILTFNYNSSTSSLLLICSAIMYVIEVLIFEKKLTPRAILYIFLILALLVKLFLTKSQYY